MKATVIKVGGSSSADAERIKRVVDITMNHYANGDNPVLVPSAMGVIPGSGGIKVTDTLIAVADSVYEGIQIGEPGKFYSDILPLIRRLSDQHQAVERVFGIEGTTANLFAELDERARTGKFDAALPRGGIRDFFAPNGERTIVQIYRELIEQRGVKAIVVDTTLNGGFITDSNFENAALLPGSLGHLIADHYLKVKSMPWNKDSILIYTGYGARDGFGHVTTFGRDGTNTTALALGAAINAGRIIIYSDLQGVLAVDSNYVKGAQTIRQLNYAEILALAERGVKVFQPNSLRVHKVKGRVPPIHMRSTSGGLETLISSETRGHGTMKGIGVLKDIGFREFPVEGVEQYEQLLRTMSQYPGIKVIQSELVTNGDGMFVRAIIATDQSIEEAKIDPQYYRQKLMDEIANSVFGGKEPKGRVRLSNAYFVTVAGSGIGNSRSEMAKLESILAKTDFPPEVAGVRYHLQPIVSEHSIGIVVPRQNGPEVIRRIYQQLKKVNVILHGPGNVGLEFLKRVADSYDALGLSVVGIVDSSSYLTQMCGLSRDELVRAIEEKRNHGNFEGFKTQEVHGRPIQADRYTGQRDFLPVFSRIASNATGDFILVDASASQDTHSDTMLPILIEALRKGMRIVSANKVPYVQMPPISDPDYHGPTLEEFDLLYAGISKGTVFNRATVGANLGAPDTLRDILMQSPSSVTIYMAPSGTLGYVGSKLDAKMLCSEAIRSAIENGFTEPFPYTDFSGQDVFNKAFILGYTVANHFGTDLRVKHRESFLDAANRMNGHSIDMDALRSLKGDAFVQAVTALDPAFEMLAAKAGKKHVLRYVATIQPNKKGVYEIEIGLKPFHEDSLMGSIKGPQNVFLFGVNGGKPRQYFPSGPGAGIDVTVDALFAGVEKFVREFRS